MATPRTSDGTAESQPRPVRRSGAALRTTEPITDALTATPRCAGRWSGALKHWYVRCGRYATRVCPRPELHANYTLRPLKDHANRTKVRGVATCSTWWRSGASAGNVLPTLNRFAYGDGTADC